MVMLKSKKMDWVWGTYSLKQLQSNISYVWAQVWGIVVYKLHNAHKMNKQVSINMSIWLPWIKMQLHLELWIEKQYCINRDQQTTNWNKTNKLQVNKRKRVQKSYLYQSIHLFRIFSHVDKMLIWPLLVK